jgi:hypothetical protein
MSIKAYREINKNPSVSDRVKLAAMFIVGFGALGVHQMFVRHQESNGQGFFIAAGVFAVLALLPGIGRLVYIAWMGLGVTMGLFTQPIVLFIAFVLFFVPIALIFKVLGRDLMKRKIEKDSKTYWEDYEESADAASYFKQH